MADLRPLIPKQHIYNGTSHQIVIECNPYLRRILTKIYIANYTLQLSTETRFTSFQLFHRCLSHYIHYNIISNHHETSQGNGSVNNNNHNRYDITLLQRQELSKLAAASIFLACKLCNEQRRIRDVINIQHVLQMQECDGIDDQTNPPALDEQYWESKRDMVNMEQTLLRVIMFDVNVCYPHRIMILLWEENVKADKNGDANAWKKILKAAWRSLNDSLFHVDSLMCSAPSLACASLSLALDEVQCHDTTSNIHVLHEWWCWMDVTQKEMVEVKQKLLEAARISKLLVPTPTFLENTGE
mmetsp:Transcript_26607/g.39417  ORF Transcript_26607/g.39417 Transcript_26607/m.39417 type:complete len:299 (+) Transcript_26607:49-945(+)